MADLAGFTTRIIGLTRIEPFGRRDSPFLIALVDRLAQGTEAAAGQLALEVIPHTVLVHVFFVARLFKHEVNVDPIRILAARDGVELNAKKTN